MEYFTRQYSDQCPVTKNSLRRIDPAKNFVLTNVFKLVRELPPLPCDESEQKE